MTRPEMKPSNRTSASPSAHEGKFNLAYSALNAGLNMVESWVALEGSSPANALSSTTLAKLLNSLMRMGSSVSIAVMYGEVAVDISSLPFKRLRIRRASDDIAVMRTARSEERRVGKEGR